ncbi:beta strand repeat-containing protein [Spirosoma endophyticum]|uniref:Conserved repeat domain-containing protein n=1 Tax=Spirosoma endophyticum TaxID=662367 RepID=A0A1I1VLP3_9BACT|nr:DUF11 domain-containing protein [Spirosoma endophyticum]SFD83744.1 conserved repeat domain-containing protein [Spirosoma endophyticum]
MNPNATWPGLPAPMPLSRTHGSTHPPFPNRLSARPGEGLIPENKNVTQKMTMTNHFTHKRETPGWLLLMLLFCLFAAGQVGAQNYVYPLTRVNSGGSSGDGGLASAAFTISHTGLADDGTYLYFMQYRSTTTSATVRRINKATGIIDLYTNNSTGVGLVDGPVASAKFGGLVFDIQYDGAGNLFIADFDNSAVRKINIATGIVSTVTTFGSNDQPTSVAAKNGILYIGTELYVYKYVLATNTKTIVAGNGTLTNVNGANALSSGVAYVGGLCINSTGTLLYFNNINLNTSTGSTLNSGAKKLDLTTGILTNIDCNNCSSPSLADNVPLNTTRMGTVGNGATGVGRSMAIDQFDNLYLSTPGVAAIGVQGAYISRVNTITGILTHVIGNNSDGTAGTVVNNNGGISGPALSTGIWGYLNVNNGSVSVGTDGILYTKCGFNGFRYSAGMVPDAPSLTKSVSPSTIVAGGTATYTFTITNTGTTNFAQSGLSFTDALPSGLRIAATPGVTVSGLTGGSVAATAGGTSIAASGYSIAAGATGTITVNVTNATGQLNASCGANPAAFTNGAANITAISTNMDNNVGDVCLVVAACTTPSTPTVASATQPTCAVGTGTINLSGLPSGAWTLNRTGTSSATITGTGTTYADAGLAPGTYTYTVTVITCTSPATSAQTINAAPATPSAPTFATTTQPTCSVATGTINLTGLPATGTWTLTRSGTSSATLTGSGTTYANTGLAPGTYTYTVTNASGCISPVSAAQTVNSQPATPSTPTFAASVQPTCAVGTGTINLTGLPATGTWTLTRSGTSSATLTGTGTTYADAGLAPGTYTYTVANAGGCTSAASAAQTINAQPAAPSAPTFATTTQPTCSVATGTINLTGLPATGTWTLTRSGTSSATLTGSGTTYADANLAAGTYTYTVTNAGGCTSSASAAQTVNPQPAAPSAPTFATTTQPTCSVATGTINLTGLPATGTWTLTRSGTSSATITGTGTTYANTGLAPGTYTYTVTNAGGCTSPASAAQTVNSQPATPSAPTFAASVQPTCAVGTGTINLTGLPATGTWTLNRTGTSSATITGTGTTYSNTGLAPGTYTYTVTNAGGCTSPASAAQTINAAPVTPVTPTLSATSTTNVCSVTTASLSALVTSTTPAGSTLEFHTSATPTAGNLVSTPGAIGAGTYYAFYVNTTGGCYSPASAAITVTITTCSPSDLTPIMTVLPSTTYGTTNITLVTDVYEINSVATTGPITVYVSKDPLLTVTFNGSATFINGKTVQNSAWTMTSNSSYYILTSTQTIPGGGKLSFGLNAVMTPGATTGVATMSVTIIGSSGGETNGANNTDSEKINYFSN